MSVKSQPPSLLPCLPLPDEMYELLSNLPESVAYTCTNCTKRQPAEWRTALEKELQGLVRQVLTALLNSRTSTHLLRYRQVRGYGVACLGPGVFPDHVTSPGKDLKLWLWGVTWPGFSCSCDRVRKNSGPWNVGYN